MGIKLLNFFFFSLTIFGIGFIQPAFGQIPVKYLGINQGLSNNSVRCVYQDSKGYIWLGTYYGLDRFDGNEFKIFTNKLNDSTSLPHNYIYTIHEDKFNNLWVSTGQALAVYNSGYNKFSQAYYIPADGTQPVKVSFGVNAINSDSKGNVFLGTDVGLLVKKWNEKNAKQTLLTAGGGALSNYSMRAITIINDSVWLFIRDWGLALYNTSTKKIELVNHDITNGTCMQPDRNGFIWVGSESGLYKYSISSGRYVESYKEGPGSLSSGLITSICQDKNGKIWIGTDGAGVSILDPGTKIFEYILPGEGKNKLSSESVNSIIADKESRIWIGTLRGGCDVVDEEKNRFSTVSHIPFSDNSLPSNFIYSFCEDKDNDLLIGTDGGGLSVWNRSTNTFHNYKHINGVETSLSNNSVASIKQDSYGNIWLATFGGGINKFNKSNGTFEHFACINEATKSENRVAWLLYEDKEKDLWACTYGDGKLYKFNRMLNRFQVYSQDFNNLVSLAEDSHGNFWGGNSAQLIEIDRSSNHKDHFFEIGKPVRSIYEDKNHNFWLGTEGGGLILFDATKKEIIHRYAETDGLCNNAVLNILEDSTGCLWLSTFNGLSKFDPLKKTFTNFYQSDGLQSNQFSYRAASLLKSGEMVFGGINGFNIFYPQKIEVRNYMPSVYITDISVNSKPISEAENYIAKVNDVGITELKIPYNKAVLSFRFNALEYSSPDKISYAYYLEGWDKGWNYSGNTRNINYNNISEGTYTLHIKNTNINGIWNNKETLLKIIVLPPWYRSWWAYLIYFLIAVGLFYTNRRYRIQKTRLKYEIELAHIEAEKEKEISEKRQSFFTNITHEFRTPLTLIINPVKDLMKKESEGVEKNELNYVYRNARRLLSLVDQLLLFRKAESETGQLNISKENFCQLCHDSYLYFTQQAKSKNIDYVFECNNRDLEVYADKGKLEIIFFNLLSNALKFTPDNGRISFRITETAETIEAEIKDSGSGIPESAKNKLFEKFYQVKEKNKPGKPGFGIGLYLVRQFIDQHNGSIRYSSKVGEGTSFYVSLPKGQDHFGASVIQEGENTDHGLVDEILAGAETLLPESKDTSDGLESIVSERQSILIADDNTQMRAYLAEIFSHDFIVHEAGNGEEGLRIAKEYQPDIIISDVVMGDMTGVDFCRVVKESSTLNHIPFILITGSSSQESKLKGIEYGADDYITKPFEKDMLVARVQSLIKKQENLQKYFYNEITHQQNTLNISAEYKEFLEACIAIVERNIDNDEFNIQKLANEISMSHSKLYKKIKAISGQSANAFIRFIRLRKAAELFINTNYNINETAFYVGIKDMKYFREQFTKTFGIKPSEYIEKYRKPFAKNYKLNEKIKKDIE